MGSVGSDGYGYFPQMQRIPPHNHDGVGTLHMYVPWWKYDRKNGFPRGYHIELGGGRGMPHVGMFDGGCNEYEGYGAGLKKLCRSMYGTFIGLSCRREMLPDAPPQFGVRPTYAAAMGDSGTGVYFSSVSALR